MAKRSAPRHGSMMYWPRKRAKKVVPRIRSWANSKDAKPLGFYGYKVQMVHVMTTDNRPTSRTKGEIISIPSTILECPPMRLFSARFYKKTSEGLQIATEILLTNDKQLIKRVPLPKKAEPNFEKINPEDYAEVRVLAYTQPHLTSIGQKTPEILEFGIGGSTSEQFAWIKEHYNKDVLVTDILNEGEQVDVVSVSKGKGFQGVVKRFGVMIKQAKSEKKKRSVGNLGPWHPSRVMFTVPQCGKMGFHTRLEKNKWILKITDEDINPAGGFKHYGKVNNQYIILKGSVPGPSKRIVRFVRPKMAKRTTPKEAPVIDKVIIK